MYLLALEILLYEVCYTHSSSIWKYYYFGKLKAVYFWDICFLRRIWFILFSTCSRLAIHLICVATSCKATALTHSSSNYVTLLSAWRLGCRNGCSDYMLLVRQRRYFGLICGRGGYFSVLWTVQTRSGAHSVCAKGMRLTAPLCSMPNNLWNCACLPSRTFLPGVNSKLIHIYYNQCPG